MGLLSNILRQQRPIEGRNVDGRFCAVDEGNPSVVDAWVMHASRSISQVLWHALHQLETGEEEENNTYRKAERKQQILYLAIGNGYLCYS